MALTLTLSQIIELSGGNPRRMKQLANEGVFKANADRGVRSALTYTMPEAVIACIVAALDRFNIKSGTLSGVAESLRSIYAVQAQYGFKNGEDARKFWARDTMLTINADLALTLEEKTKQAAVMGLPEYPTGKPSGVSAEEVRRIRNYSVLEDARAGKPTQLALAITDDGGWTYWLDRLPHEEDKVGVFIVVNLHRVLEALN